ncbi:uncharacterized protein LOC122322431 [Drosophila grimshawi]|uniref:uncharacterized protein LOC122322431 n=1 Tax=Drosophila grimshawi TaxID=7222 RepID=UPI001C9324EF|nr:uncharacterized protein LOC122322431 [Drosophila grimshawi]
MESHEEKLATCTRKNLLPAIACKIELCANIWPKTAQEIAWGPPFRHGYGCGYGRGRGHGSDVVTVDERSFPSACIDFWTTIKSFLHAQTTKCHLLLVRRGRWGTGCGSIC